MSEYARLANAIREQSLGASYDKSQPRHATISSYDPTTHAVKVLIQPEEVESGWMPLGAIGVGNGFGVAVGPNIGDMVLVVFAEGDFGAGNIVGRYFNVENPAIPVPSGEIWAVTKSGTSFKLRANGDVQMHVAGNYVETVTGTTSRTASAHQINGPVMTDSTLTTGDDITDNTLIGNTRSQRGMREAYDVHGHPVPNVQGGSDVVETDPPTPQV